MFRKKILQDDGISDDITEASDTVSLSVSFSGSTSDELMESNANNTLNKIKHHTQLYLDNNVQRPQVHILIALKKIRLNDPYSRLAIDFGLQKGSIAKIIRKTLSPLAHFMRGNIFSRTIGCRR